MSLNGRKFNASDLEVVPSPQWFNDPREPQLSLGNFVRLNSGGPIMMVVDREGHFVVVSWQDLAGNVREHRFPAVCVHRVLPASAETAAPSA